MTIDLLVARAERMPVILHERGRNRGIPEAWVAIHIGSRPLGDIAACCLRTIMVALFSSLRVGRGGGGGAG
jgi:hypothetical protein